MLSEVCVTSEKRETEYIFWQNWRKKIMMWISWYNIGLIVCVTRTYALTKINQRIILFKIVAHSKKAEKLWILRTTYKISVYRLSLVYLMKIRLQMMTMRTSKPHHLKRRADDTQNYLESKK